MGGNFHYADYASVLEKYVDERGMVNYRELKANPGALDSFLGRIASLDERTYEGWPDEEKIALWLNAYNALTLEAIISNYPIEPSWFRSLIYPKNSIRQIPGVWDKLAFTVMGREVTLDEIEHQILRNDFSEPRVHLALVCASLGCATLRKEPYTGERLVAQLDDQARGFLEDPEKFRIERSEGTVYLSPIFKWFGEDFVQRYGGDSKLSGHGGSRGAVLSFIIRYLPPQDREYLETASYRVKYLDYDWSLNEQASAPSRPD